MTCHGGMSGGRGQSVQGGSIQGMLDSAMTRIGAWSRYLTAKTNIHTLMPHARPLTRRQYCKEAGRTPPSVGFFGQPSNLWCVWRCSRFFLQHLPCVFILVGLSNLSLSLCCAAVYMLGNKKNKGLMPCTQNDQQKWATVFGMRVGGWTKPILLLLLLTECVATSCPAACLPCK
jgi:hypothetical protein